MITTPNGQIGHQLLPLLAGLPVRALAHRDGSHGDAAVVDKAFAGADTVFWVVPPNRHATDVSSYYVDFTRPACAAIARYGVKRVVAVSSLGYSSSTPAGHLSAAFAMDDLFASTGVAYRSLRMPFFMDNFLGQAERIRTANTFTLANSADRVLLTVATSDVAAAAADLLTDDTWTGQSSVPVIGPDNLTPRQMAAVMSEALNRPIRCESVSVAEYEATFRNYGMSESLAHGMAQMVTAQNNGIYDEEASSPRAKTSFREWCAGHLA